MKKFLMILLCLGIHLSLAADEIRQVPEISCTCREGWFPLVSGNDATVIYTDIEDFNVTGIRTDAKAISSHKDIPEGAAVIAGTLGNSRLADWIVRKNGINTDASHPSHI